MSIKRITGWVAECDDCGDNVSDYVTDKRATLKAIEDEDAFHHGSLLVCYRCLRRRACDIFGHQFGPWLPTNTYGTRWCRRCTTGQFAEDLAPKDRPVFASDEVPF